MESAHPVTLKTFLKNSHDKWWRINNLYYVLNEEGQRVLFKARWAQEKFFREMWTMNIILKARQLGFTTLIDIMALDECLFNKNFEAAIIAQGKKQTRDIFRRKIDYPYRNLPTYLTNKIQLTTDSKEELEFNNGSIISVATSIRSATVQFLHISEHGKICRKNPDKAEEIRTGSLNSVHSGQTVIIESTAEGRHGDYYDYCQGAMSLSEKGLKLTPLDFKFHFFPWFKHPDYEFSEADTEKVNISDEMAEYFFKIEAELGITLRPGQKAWYAKKAEKMLDKMKQEFPATPDEAFQQSVDGAIYGKQLAVMRKDTRITSVPYDEYAPVHTAWDLGRSVGNAMSVWFFQVIGKKCQVINYVEKEGEDFVWFKRHFDSLPYKYGTHFAPHDINVTDIVVKAKRIDRAKEIGLIFKAIPRTPDLINSIEDVKRFFPNAWIDEDKANQGVKCLENYVKKWNEKNEVWSDDPLHNWASNGADSFRTMERAYDMLINPIEEYNYTPKPIRSRSYR